MKKIILLVSSILWIGCGGGGSSGGATYPNVNNTEVTYKNKVLPKIGLDTIPEILLNKDTAIATKTSYLLKENANESSAFINLKERVNYFYFRQMLMNMELSYLDSVWIQIEEFCVGKSSCDIPKDKIIFTYTESLYKHDIELITLFEKKTLDISFFQTLKSELKAKIGSKNFLGVVNLIYLSNNIFDYELKADISNITTESDDLTTILHWNKELTLYSLREELYNGYNGDEGICQDRVTSTIYTGYDYNKTTEQVKNTFEYGYDATCISTSTGTEGKSQYLQKHNRLFKLVELPTKLNLNEHISSKIIDENYNEPLNFYLEGELDEEGGFLIASDSQGNYNNETFDSDGNVITIINCIGDESRSLDDCKIKGVDAIKDIVTKSVYKFGTYEPFVNTMAHYSAVFLNADNTVDALVNCSIFKADYTLTNEGISFSNIQEEQNNSLVCLDEHFKQNFKNFLETGYTFSSDGYIVWNGLSAELDVLDKKSDFNKSNFLKQMTIERYVDSYTMNNLFKVYGVSQNSFMNLVTNQKYFLSKEPSMKIENDKIYFNLIDATFEADIEVIDNDKIRFKTILKVMKNNIVYPVRNCTNTPGPNECLDGNENLMYEDQTFTKVIEDFLNTTVNVSNGGTPDNGDLWFHTEVLSFIANY